MAESTATRGFEWNVTPEQYHADYSRYGKSNLDVARKSLREFHERFVLQIILPDEPTADMEFGRLTHWHVLEEGKWEQHVAVAPSEGPDGKPWNRSYKLHKEAWATFEYENAHKSVISSLDCERICNIALAIERNPKANALIYGDGPVEQAIAWEDSETSLPLKALRDKVRVSPRGPIIVDLKTTKDVSPKGFAWTVQKYGYHRQAAHYLDGHEAVYGEEAVGFAFIAVSKEPPHDCAVYELKPDAIMLGRLENRKTLNQLAECFASGDWTPPFEKQVNMLDLPPYVYTQTDWSEL